MSLLSIFEMWFATAVRPNSFVSVFDRSLRHIWAMDGLQRRFPTQSDISPSVVEEGGSKKLRWSFDVSGFDPENVKVRTYDGKLEVKARREEKSNNHENIREFTRILAIPDGTGLEGMASKLSDMGVLTIEAPYTPPAIEQKPTETVVPIKHD